MNNFTYLLTFAITIKPSKFDKIMNVHTEYLPGDIQQLKLLLPDFDPISATIHFI